MTLGIYAIQVLIAEGAYKALASYADEYIPSDGCSHALVYDYFVTPIAAIIAIAFAYLIIHVVRKNKCTRLILLGE